MKTLVLIFIVASALLFFIAGAVLLTFTARGSGTLFFPGLRVVISTRFLLALITAVEILVAGSAVMIWRSL